MPWSEALIVARELAPGCSVGAGEACDLLIFRSRFKCKEKDRSLVALDSSYSPPQKASSPHRSVLAATGTRRRSRGRVDLRPFFGGIGVQRQRMELAHQLAQRAVDLLVTLDAIEPFELLADHHGLEVGLQATAVHVAFIQHLQVLGLQEPECRFCLLYTSDAADE